MTDVPSAPAEGDTPHAESEQWLSFESRMRRRCVGRCLRRADLAMDEGCLPEARLALDEACQLDSRCAELAALEERFAELQNTQTAAAAAPSVPRLQASAVAVPSRKTRRWYLVAGAGMVIVITGAAVGSVYWGRSGRAAPAAATPGPLAVSTAGIPVSKQDAPESARGLRVVQETITAPAVTPELVAPQPDLPAFPAPPIAPPEPEPEPEPVTLAVNRGESSAPPRIPDPVTPEARFEAVASAPPPEPPPASPAATSPPPAVDAPSPAPRLNLAGASRREPKPVDESSGVRGVLARYERAYNSLDASAASEIWPAVDRQALARAFDGLASQRVSLQACDVTVTGTAARASCSGTAMWVPKVGGGARTAARQWDFELRKLGDDWQIDRAIAQER